MTRVDPWAVPGEGAAALLEGDSLPPAPGTAGDGWTERRTVVTIVTAGDRADGQRGVSLITRAPACQAWRRSAGRGLPSGSMVILLNLAKFLLWRQITS